MYRIEAVLKSPLMIGGKKLDNNYRESKGYIPGSVLRAAYAKALIQRCPYEQENNVLTYRKTQEETQEESMCGTCSFQTVCSHFSEITFPALYPMGGKPYPVTAREKKYGRKGETGTFDILKSRLAGKGKLPEESEWRQLKGIYKDKQKIELIHAAITRTAIDYYRNAAKEGSLYTQNVILEKYRNENDKLCDVVFSGQMRLSAEEEKELSLIPILHIGADISRGFGICHMYFAEEPEDDTLDQLKARIEDFNEGIEGEQQFVVLDLLTDAYLNLEDIGPDTISQTEISDEQMLSFLEDQIGLPKEIYRLYKAFKFQEVRRGIDTSEKTEGGMRRPARIVVEAGAVFVYKAQAEDENKAELFELEKRGIGSYTSHGFGRIRVCDSFHVDNDISRRNKAWTGK